MYELYDGILDDLKLIAHSAKPIQNFKDGNYVSEGTIEIRGYHEYIDKLIYQFEDEVEKKQKEQKKKKLKDLKDALDKIIDKCDDDNSYATKSITLPDVSEINEIFRLYRLAGEKISSFITRSYETEDDVAERFEEIEGNIERINSNINITFSFKVNVSLHFMVRNFYELIDKCKIYFFVSNSSKSDNYLCILGDSLKKVKELEKSLNSYFAKDKESISYTEKDDARITKRVLSCFNSLLGSYNSTSILLFNKTYTMLVNCIDKVK